MEALYDYLFGVLAAVLITGGTYLTRKVAKHLSWLDSDVAADQVERYAQMAIDMGRGWVDDDRELWEDNERLNQLTQWVAERAPEAMRIAGFTSDDVAAMVRGQLQSLLRDKPEASEAGE